VGHLRYYLIISMKLRNYNIIIHDLLEDPQLTGQFIKYKTKMHINNYKMFIPNRISYYIIMPYGYTITKLEGISKFRNYVYNK